MLYGVSVWSANVQIGTPAHSSSQQPPEQPAKPSEAHSLDRRSTAARSNYFTKPDMLKARVVLAVLSHKIERLRARRQISTVWGAISKRGCFHGCFWVRASPGSECKLVEIKDVDFEIEWTQRQQGPRPRSSALCACVRRPGWDKYACTQTAKVVQARIVFSHTVCIDFRGGK